jgi:circadian clock protein KaiC
VLFISLGEPEGELRQDARTMGFDVSGVRFLDLSPSAEFFSEVQSYDIFSAADVEREPVTRRIVEQVAEIRPRRVFIDSLTQLRYLAPDPFQFRKQALSFLRFLVDRGATVLMTSEGTRDAPDDDLRFMADGVVELELRSEGRVLSVTKLRGSDFQSGRHSLRLSAQGMTVFPRLLPEAYRREVRNEPISSGIPDLDQMLGGGLERGTVTIITGPTGVGKTTLGLVFLKEAAVRGERSVVYTFEENTETLLGRCESVSIPVREMIDRGTLSVMKVEPLQFTPDEFARLVRQQVEELDTRIVMIDSISGYRLSLRSDDLVAQIHALAKYLANMGVTVLLVNEVEAITGDFRATDVGVSYLADNIVFLRYVEIDGELRKAIGVLKKRLSAFDKTIREMSIASSGLSIGAPLRGLRGILRGTSEAVPIEDTKGER